MMLAASSSRKRSPPLDFGTPTSSAGHRPPARALVAWIVLDVAREGDSCFKTSAMRSANY
jgi:hypothetical protein